MSEPQGWTPVEEAPSGWTPVDEPTFRTTNAKDAEGNAIVADLMDRAGRGVSLIPSIGGGIGGMAGGPLGAAIGGAAGSGYQQIAQHYKEIVPALMDVLSNLRTEPGATLRGAVSGAESGAADAGIAGVEQGAMDALGGLITKGLGAGAKAVYRGYLKPSLAKAALGKADQAVETALQEALPVTKAGSRRANQVIKELRAEVDGILKNTTGDVNLSDVADKVRAFAKKKYFKPGQPMADYEAAMKVANELDQHPSIVNPMAPGSPAMATPTAANDIKSALDATIGESNFGVERGATKTAQKVGRYQLRKGLEQVAPEIAPLNARESKLIDAAKAIDRAVAREGNQNILHGAKTLASGALGAEEYRRRGNPYEAAATALAVRAGLTPAVASRAAIVAYRLGQMSGAVPATAARVAVTLALRPETEPPAGQP